MAIGATREDEKDTPTRTRSQYGRRAIRPPIGNIENVWGRDCGRTTCMFLLHSEKGLEVQGTLIADSEAEGSNRAELAPPVFPGLEERVQPTACFYVCWGEREPEESRLPSVVPGLRWRDL